MINKPLQLDVLKTKELIGLNFDSRQYFFSQADENWLDWLWENGFLDIIKEKSKDPAQYGFRTPEPNYLVKVSNKVPEKVVDIMLDVPISSNTFNPEVINQFLRICSSLPAEQLARMVQKIRDEKWINLMFGFNRWGFEYEKMFEILENDYNSALILAEAILVVRTKEELAKTSNNIISDNPFYLNDLSYTKVFEYLAKVDSDYTEQTFSLVTKVMAKIVNLGDKTGSEEVFPIKERFYLFDIDFFTLEIEKGKHLSQRDDVRELAAVIKKLATFLFDKKCADEDVIRKYYEQYINPLPKSRTMWRLRLFIFSLCPEVFQVELKQSFFRLFEVKRYNELISGTEYKKALRVGFIVLSEADKREYVKRAIEYFMKKDGEKENERENWHKTYGSRILSMITVHLTKEENQQIKKLGFKLDSNYEPEPSIGSVRSGDVVSRGPISQEEFGNLSIAEIAEKLQTDWTPKNLSKQNTSDNFLNPLNAEGAGDLLRIDISNRTQDYVSSANLFFERDVLDQHFTYSFFRGIEEILRGNKENISGINWDNLLILCIEIKKSDQEKFSERGKRERDSFDTWLSGWNVVHSVMADIIQELLTENDGIINMEFSKYREQFFEIISYLLSYSDPTPEDEKIESATMKTKSSESDEYVVGDPHTMAINTVRGRAFQAFAMFVYQDGKKFVKGDKIKISDDVKELYEMILNNENTRAIMFMFGRYIPTFYFRDRLWIQKLLSQIFPSDPAKKSLYTAAWEGYLSNNIYEEIFFDPEIQKLYKRGIALTDVEQPKQMHSKEPDEGVAAHLALAFMYYNKFGFKHKLFKTFWEKNNPKQHTNFVSFLGRSFISGNNASINELLKKEPKSKQRLKKFWDLMLRDYDSSKLFTKFGFWISLEKDIFTPEWLAKHVKMTLKKTKGNLDWDYELVKVITQLAKESPEDTLEVVRLYLFEGGVHGKNIRAPLYIDSQWLDALKILYDNPTTKSGTYSLIDDLIREGGSTFWGLKKILDDNSS